MSWSSEDIDVVIDMLDDPLRRWFAADALISVLWNKLLTDAQKKRLADILGTGTYNYNMETVLIRISRDMRAPQVVINLKPLQPVQHWLCHDRLFETEEAAQAYADFMAWQARGR